MIQVSPRLRYLLSWRYVASHTAKARFQFGRISLHLLKSVKSKHLTPEYMSFPKSPSLGFDNKSPLVGFYNKNPSLLGFDSKQLISILHSQSDKLPHLEELLLEHRVDCQRHREILSLFPENATGSVQFRLCEIIDP